MPIRVYDLAKELGLTSSELVKKCRAAGLKMRGHMSTLDDREARLVRKLFPPPPPEVLEKRKAEEVAKKARARKLASKRKKDKRAATKKKKVKEKKEKEAEVVVEVVAAEAEAGLAEVVAGAAEAVAGAAEAEAEAMPVVAEVATGEEAAEAVEADSVYGIVRQAEPGDAETLQKRRRPSGKSKGLGRVTPIQPAEAEEELEYLRTRQDDELVHGPRQWGEEPQVQRIRSRAEGGPEYEWSGRRTRTRRRPVFHPMRRRGKRFPAARGQAAALAGARVQGTIGITLPITPRKLSETLGVRVPAILQKLMAQGKMAGVNDILSEDVALLLALEYAVTLNIRHEADLEEDLVAEFERPEEIPDDLVSRGPVVTFLGHVDHGKTSLLDAIRESKVAQGEAGGITQHIGAYQVTRNGKSITFLDTPGHEAFTAMRARGAQTTDIAVLVVAADDGVMPQTEEAIAHARDAGVPIVVAINKCDLPAADPQKVRRQLATLDLATEDWGGKVQAAEVSALTKQGLDDLLEKILLEAEVLDLRTNPARPASGAVLEGSLSEGRGPVARVLVRNGTLHRGEVLLCGATYGTVRMMNDFTGRSVGEAGASTPVEVIGLTAVPGAGDRFYAIGDIDRAKRIAERREIHQRMAMISTRRPVRIEDIAQLVAEGQKVELKIVLKADVMGSLGALRDSILLLGNEEAKVRIVHAAVGTVNLSDVLLADAAGAIVVGFGVDADLRARALARDKEIDLRIYRVIYELLDELRGALEGILPPEDLEIVTGHLEVRQVFKISRVGAIAGCYVTDGTVERSGYVRVLRGEEVVFTGEIESLRHLKDDVREAREGFECGLKLDGFDDVQAGDRIEAYRVEEVSRKL